MQHMIARGSYPHAANQIIGRTDNAMTKIALTKAPSSLLECAVCISARKKLIYAMSLDTDRPTNRAMVVGCAVSATRNYLKLHVPRTLNPLLCNAHAKTRKLCKRSAGLPPLEAIPRRSIHQPSVAAQTLHVASCSRRAYHRERRRH